MRFVGLIVEALAATGVVEPVVALPGLRTNEGPDQALPTADVEVIFDRIAEIMQHAFAAGT